MGIEDKLGGRLQRLRKKAGLSQTDLARATRINVQTISRYERGVLAPSVDALEKLAHAMRLEITSFFVDDDRVPDLPSDVLKIVQLLEAQDQDTVRRVHRALKALLA